MNELIPDFSKRYENSLSVLPIMLLVGISFFQLLMIWDPHFLVLMVGNS